MREMAVQRWLTKEGNEELRAATADRVVIEQRGGAKAWLATALRNPLTETLTEIFTLVFSFLSLLHVQNQNVMTVSLALIWLGHIHERGVGKRGAEGRDVGDVERRSGRRCVARCSPNQLVCCTVLLRLGRAASVAREHSTREPASNMLPHVFSFFPGRSTGGRQPGFVSECAIHTVWKLPPASISVETRTIAS